LRIIYQARKEEADPLVTLAKSIRWYHPAELS
jgi:hypothetical protein